MIDYASEMAWREDIRRQSINEQFAGVLGRVFEAGISNDWVNCCRGNTRKGAMLYQAVPR